MLDQGKRWSPVSEMRRIRCSVAPAQLAPAGGPDTRSAPHAKQDPIAARRLLVAQVRDLATGVGLAIRTARALHLPIEPGVAEARDKLILWAHLLDDVIP